MIMEARANPSLWLRPATILWAAPPPAFRKSDGGGIMFGFDLAIDEVKPGVSIPDAIGLHPNVRFPPKATATLTSDLIYPSGYQALYELQLERVLRRRGGSATSPLLGRCCQNDVRLPEKTVRVKPDG